MDNFDKSFWDALEELVRCSEVVIDRPKGTVHPCFPGLVYPTDYGYLRGTVSMDGEGIDVWAGSGGKRPGAMICTVDLLKRDAEIKILLGCTEEETALIEKFHNQTPFMKGILLCR